MVVKRNLLRPPMASCAPSAARGEEIAHVHAEPTAIVLVHGQNCACARFQFLSLFLSAGLAQHPTTVPKSACHFRVIDPANSFEYLDGPPIQ